MWRHLIIRILQPTYSPTYAAQLIGLFFYDGYRDTDFGFTISLLLYNGLPYINYVHANTTQREKTT